MQQATQFHWKRRLTQLITLLLFVLVPVSGIFRIDLTTASFVVFGQHIWWSNYALIFGLALMVATAPILTYMTIGTVWCGWACPQNLLSEWANKLTHKLLGKRASVDIDQSLQVAAAKNKPLNWIILTLAFLGAAMVLSVVPFFFFFTPADVWSLITFDSSNELATFMRRLYYFTVFLVFLDIAVIRYFFCDYICVYRIGQRIFKTKDALHIEYDASRSADCTKCNYCSASCITGINPTKFETYDSCINCGECVDACNRLHAKSGTYGLLSFGLGEAKGPTSFGKKLRAVLARSNWLVGAVFLAGLLMFGWGVHTQQQEQARQQAKQAVQQKILQLTGVCKGQCSAQHAACTAGNLSACYEAAACECQCLLKADPSSPSSGAWQQCVQQNTAKAAAVSGRRLSGVGKSAPLTGAK
ncbi:MAG: 4Fe-4S binding protein [Sideroxydans sp.]|nr:4Fe-4S binding protein [Sideroxydans sp.]